MLMGCASAGNPAVMQMPSISAVRSPIFPTLIIWRVPFIAIQEKNDRCRLDVIAPIAISVMPTKCYENLLSFKAFEIRRA
jgi:hypothetical protein